MPPSSHFLRRKLIISPYGFFYAVFYRLVYDPARAVCVWYWWVFIFYSLSSDGEAVSHLWLTRLQFSLLFVLGEVTKATPGSNSWLEMANLGHVIRGIKIIFSFSSCRWFCTSQPCKSGLWIFSCHCSQSALVLENIYFVNTLICNLQTSESRCFSPHWYQIAQWRSLLLSQGSPTVYLYLL